MVVTISPVGKGMSCIHLFFNGNSGMLTASSCGREFCYACEKVWKTCTCPVWHENRLVAMANQAVAEDVPRDANEADRQNAYNQAVNNLQQHEDIACEHHRDDQWAFRTRGSMECEICHDVLPDFVFMCRNCRMRVCAYCRRHRLR